MTTESEPMLRTASGCDAPSGKASCAGVADQPSAGTAADGSASVGVAAGKPAIRDGRPADGTADGTADGAAAVPSADDRPAAGGACPLGAGAGEGGSRIERIEPPSWWVGMRTPLQLLVKGRGIASWQVAVDGCEGVRVTALHPGTSPNYLFVDVDIAPTARPGRIRLRFTRGGEHFGVDYELAARPQRPQRASFSTADVLYLVMPDRFADGDPSTDNDPSTAERCDRRDPFGRHGGDLPGLTRHLDYIARLGATAVWCTPVLLDNEQHQSYHAYATADYYRVDPRMGGNEAYFTFVGECHRRGLKVVMDVVTNHCGSAHWWMEEPPFDDWVHRHRSYTPTNNLFSTHMDPNASRYDLEVLQSGWFDRSMPDMNLDNPFVLNYFRQWAVWWIERAGIDGLRVDTYPYNEKGPMSAWCASVRREYPWLNIVGECWTTDIPRLAYWQSGQMNRDGFDSHLPALMDFPLQEALCSALRPGRRGGGMMRLYDCLADDFVYHNPSNLVTFFGNHDTERLADVVGGSWRRMKIAFALLATLRGIPQIFAGDELGLRTTDAAQGHGALRRDFPGGWAGDARNCFEESGRLGEAGDLCAYVQRLFTWRRQCRVLHTGRTMHFAPEDECYAFFRYDRNACVFVFVNNSRRRVRIPWSHYAEIAAPLREGRNVVTGERVTLSERCSVAPLTALVVEFDRGVAPTGRVVCDAGDKSAAER